MFLKCCLNHSEASGTVSSIPAPRHWGRACGGCRDGPRFRRGAEGTSLRAPGNDHGGGAAGKPG